MSEAPASPNPDQDSSPQRELASKAGRGDDASCKLCGLPIGDAGAARKADEESGHGDFCCPGCAAVYSILNPGEGGAGDAESVSLARTIMYVRFGVAVFLAFLIMVFSMALYGDQIYGDTYGHMPEPIRDFFRWVTFFFAIPAIWLLGGLQVRAILATRGDLNRSFHALVLVSVAAALIVSVWAIFTGEGEIYFDTCVMLLVLVTLGRLLEGYLRSRATSGLEELLATETRPWKVERPGADEANSEELELTIAEIRDGDLLRLLPGERAPIDGVIVEGASDFSTECRDGDLTPHARGEGDVVRSGELNLARPLTLRARPSSDGATFWSEFCRLTRGAVGAPSRVERASARVASFLLPATMLLAIGTTIFWGFHDGDFVQAVWRGLAVLVVACPCAMGLATPVALRLAMSEATRMGALPRSTDLFEDLASLDHLVIDNTGTMTEKEIAVVGARLQGLASLTGDDGVGKKCESEEAETLALARTLASQSVHPVARAIAAWCASRLDSERELPEVSHLHQEAGAGLSGEMNGAPVFLGSPALLRKNGVSIPDDFAVGHTFLARGGKVLAAFDLDVPLHEETPANLRRLLDRGYSVALLTGAASLPDLPQDLLDRCAAARTGQTPDDKVRHIREARERGERVAMVGDGLNDLPALSAADVGIAVADPETTTGATADVLLMGGGLNALPRLLELAKKTRRVAWRNFAWVIGYNAIALTAAAMGRLHPLLAAILMAASSAMVVLMSLTIRKTRESFMGPTASKK